MPTRSGTGSPRPDQEQRTRSGDDIRHQPVFENADLVLQKQLALLQALDLDLVDLCHFLQGINSQIKIAVLLAQPGEFRDKVMDFGSIGFERHDAIAFFSSRLDITLDHDRKKWIPEFHPVMPKIFGRIFWQNTMPEENLKPGQTSIVCGATSCERGVVMPEKTHRRKTARLAQVCFFALIDRFLGFFFSKTDIERHSYGETVCHGYVMLNPFFTNQEDKYVAADPSLRT
jgi:hypothetical protein